MFEKIEQVSSCARTGGMPVPRPPGSVCHRNGRSGFADSLTPEHSAKPAGAKFCEIHEQLAGPAPANPDTMPQLAMESRSPHRNDFDPGDEGKTAFYALRWLNTTGDPGPWSPVYSAVVPG